MSITAILKKLAAGEALTVDEKDFLLANEDVLTDEQKEAVEGAEVEEGVEETPEEDEEVVEEEEEEVEEKAMQDLIAKAVNERVGEITDKLAE